MKHILLAIMMGMSSMALADYGVPHVERIDSVYDGDTYRVTVTEWKDTPIIGVNMPIRLRGYDTPELRSRCDDPDDKVQEKKLANEAKDFVIQTLHEAKHISLHDISRGSFFRIVADVQVDGKSLGPILEAQGLAVPFQPGNNVWCGKSKE